ncbi:MAG: hypothetical protein V4649_19950 [Bacteroidota bacterium]
MVTLQGKIEHVNNSSSAGLRAAFVNAIFTHEVLDILKRDKVESLIEKLLQGKILRKGDLVWTDHPYYFKGTIQASYDFEKEGQGQAKFHTFLKDFNELKLSGVFSPKHLFGVSSVSRLSGKASVFLFAYIEECKANEIKLRPIFIGGRMIDTGTPFGSSSDLLKVDVEDIDEFQKVSGTSHRFLKLDRLKDIPEKQIKHWIAEILYEENVPKDWGGEYSDLFSNHIHVCGQRLNAAFLLKGPSKFHPMTPADLGKNGDQITRLYDEPASMYILQHCHSVTPSVYKTMQAFSSRFNQISRFCIIDGYDTLRLLKAYNKI